MIVDIHGQGFTVTQALAEDVGAELYAVIDRAADRVGRVVVKRLDRIQPVRDAARHGARPARYRQEPVESAPPRGDIA